MADYMHHSRGRPTIVQANDLLETLEIKRARIEKLKHEIRDLQAEIETIEGALRVLLTDREEAPRSIAPGVAHLTTQSKPQPTRRPPEVIEFDIRKRFP